MPTKLEHFCFNYADNVEKSYTVMGKKLQLSSLKQPLTGKASFGYSDPYIDIDMWADEDLQVELRVEVEIVHHETSPEHTVGHICVFRAKGTTVCDAEWKLREAIESGCRPIFQLMNG
jgi:hypothetical protein